MLDGRVRRERERKECRYSVSSMPMAEMVSGGTIQYTYVARELRVFRHEIAGCLR